MSLEVHPGLDKQLKDPLGPLKQAIGIYDEEDMDDIPSPTHWPTIATDDLASEWEALRRWVEDLLKRFGYLDHHIIPFCWYRHNEHVEVLSALRDYEASSFSSTAPSTAPVDWCRALRDMSQLLKSFTSDLSCGSVHQEPELRQVSTLQSDWETFVQIQLEIRKSEEMGS